MGSDSKSDSNAPGGEPRMPAAVKKTVQHLKEIVDKNCTDSEIYAVLMECNMDPNEAVQRLLSQDSFKPVKNKRDRRKEETKDSRARCNGGTANHGVRFGSENAAGRTGSTENNYNELGKTAYNREMASAAPSISSQSSYMDRATGKVVNEPPSAHSELLNAYNRRQLTGTGDTIFPSVQLSPGLQPSWPGISKGHVSGADIVGKDGPQNKSAQMSSEIPCTSQPAVLPNLYIYHKKFPQVLLSPESDLHQDPYSSHPSSFSEMVHGPGMTDGQHDIDNEWPVTEHLPAATGSLVIDASAALDAEVYSNHTWLYSDRAEFSSYSQSDVVQIPDRDFDRQNQSSDNNGSASTSSRQIFANGAGRASNDDLLKETSSYDAHGQVSKHQEGIGNVPNLSNSSSSLNDDAISVSSAMANLQQLNIGKEEAIMLPTEDCYAVVLPNHLQAFAADCSHLSFGTYKSGVASASPMAVASNLTESNLEISAADGSSAVHPSFRNSEDCGDDHCGFMYDTEIVTTDARNYDPPVSSQPELMKQDFPEATRGHQYISPLSVPDSSIKNIQQSGSNFPFVVDPNARNHSSAASEMHLESTPSDLWALHNQSWRMRDPSSFFAMQSMPSGNASAVSSINDHTIPMPEVLNSGSSSLPQQSPHVPPGSNLANRPVIPKRQPLHSYSQPTLPFGELANMIAHPSMMQSQSYVPSALQQVYPESSRFHDSLAGMNYNLLQYRNSTTLVGLPQSNNRPSAYGNFVGNSAKIPGSFPRNPSTSLMSSAVGSDGLHSRYQDGNSFTPRQQNNRPSTWDFGVGPQTMSMPFNSAYYSLLGQNQYRAGYQHDQQASRHYESLGYPNTYPSERITRPSTRRPW